MDLRMDVIFLAFVTIMCLWVSVKIFSCEERNKVYNKYALEVEDVKKYNQFCGWLTIGFGVVADVTILLTMVDNLWVNLIGMVLLIVEAFAVTKIYAKVEKKMMKKR